MFVMKAYAESHAGKAANGQSLRRKENETMGQYLRRTGESVIGATAKTRGRPAKVVTRSRGRNGGSSAVGG